MADSRVSVLIDIRSKLAGLEQASAGFGKLIKGVAGFTAAYLSARSVISGALQEVSAYLSAPRMRLSGKPFS